jgi:type I restriction enzyme S subunit
VRLKQVCSLYGDYGLNISADEYVEDGVPIIRTSDFDDLGRLDLSDPKRVPKSAAAPKMLHRGDILFSRAGTIGRCTTYNHDSPATFAAYLVRFRPIASSVEPRFIGWWAQSQQYWSQIRADTIESTIGNFNAGKLGNLALPDVSRADQTAISDFLDRETARIDQLIEKKQRLVAVVKERRADFIHSTVTRGINPSTQFSSSGLNWAPELPSHWKPTRLKHLGQAVIGLTYSPEDLVPEGDGIPVLRANNIQSGQLVSEGLVFVSKEIPRKLILREGDIVICSRNGSRNLIGKNARVSDEFIGITFGAFNTVYRSRYSDFIYWVLQSPIFSYQAGAYLTSTINQLTVATLGNLVVPLPPPDEQKAICTHIESRMPAFNRLSDQVRASIVRLKEYRSSLITAAVTGQIDVMAWSKRGYADRQFDAIQQEATS